METAVEEINRDKELNKNKKKSDELTYGATTRQRRVTFGQILTNARPGATPWNFENIRYTNADIRYLDPNTINVVGTALDYDDDNF